MTRTGFPAFVLGAALLLTAAEGARAECLVYRDVAEFGTNLVLDMTAPSGKDCRLNVPLREKAVIDVNKITVHPHYGGARVDGFSGAYYRSNPGYRGPDRFTFEFCGRDAEKSGCSKVQVRIDVR